MKMNNKKIIVSTLALAMGAALAGSVSGTVAWFQYSTRAQAAYIGTTAHCSEALEIKVASSAYKTELKSTDLTTANANESHTGSYLEPITTGALGNNVALPGKFYKNPIYQHFAQTEWGEAAANNYVQYVFNFHVKDINGAGTASYLSKKLYLTDLEIVNLDDDNAKIETGDLYKAIRVHVSATGYNALFAYDPDGADAISTDTAGQLDLNNDGSPDTDPGYEWDTGLTAKAYGAGAQTAYNAAAEGVLADDSTATNIVSGTAGEIGTILAQEDGLAVTVTMWLEGWQKLADGAGTSTDAAVWEPATYIGKKFGVGFRFACEPHTDH